MVKWPLGQFKILVPDTPSVTRSGMLNSWVHFNYVWKELLQGFCWILKHESLLIQ
jgi:hypothetical protein